MLWQKCISALKMTLMSLFGQLKVLCGSHRAPVNTKQSQHLIDVSCMWLMRIVQWAVLICCCPGAMALSSTSYCTSLLQRRKWGWGWGRWRTYQYNTGLSVKYWKTRTHRSIPSATQPSKGVQKCVTCQELACKPQLTHASLTHPLTSTHCFLLLSTDPERPEARCINDTYAQNHAYATSPT